MEKHFRSLIKIHSERGVNFKAMFSFQSETRTNAPGTDGQLHAVLVGVLEELRVDFEERPLAGDVQVVRPRHLDDGETAAHRRDLHLSRFRRQLRVAGANNEIGISFLVSGERTIARNSLWTMFS